MDALIVRAKAFRSAGKIQEASNDFCNALRLSPENKEIRRAIAKLSGEVNKENQLLRFPEYEKLCNISGSVESIYFAEGKSRDSGSI